MQYNLYTYKMNLISLSSTIENILTEEIYLIFQNFAVYAFFFYVLLFEITFLKDQNKKYTNRDSRISNIEYRAEKQKMFSSPNRKPIWKISFDQRKIKHIHDFSVKQGGISSTIRKQSCFCIECALAKYNTIKGRVNDVT